MQKEVTLRFSAGNEVVIALHAGTELPAADEARRWLDEQYSANECVPMRATGKVLLAEKPLSIAAALGPRGFDDAAFRETFARMTLGALGRTAAVLDIEAQQLKP
jgi:hypothetical protein